MSVLIKGMKMPQGERYVDVRIFDDGRATTATGERPFYREMEVIELPPHGDLIDRDELIERAWRLNLSTRELIETMLKTAPTILEAEVE